MTTTSIILMIIGIVFVLWAIWDWYVTVAKKREYITLGNILAVLFVLSLSPFVGWILAIICLIWAVLEDDLLVKPLIRIGKRK